MHPCRPKFLHLLQIADNIKGYERQLCAVLFGVGTGQ